MILTDKEIRALCLGDKKRKIPGGMITPFTEEALQSESYDLSIGNSIVTLGKEIRVVDITNQIDIDSIYKKVVLTKAGYIIFPKEYVLVTVKERIALPDDLTAHIRPRTRFTRLGLLVSDQHCNSTYSGNLQIGLFNATECAIKIYPGIRIAQIVFEELKSKPSEEKLYKNKPDAAYQNEERFIGGVATDEFNKTVSNALTYLLQKD
ncbi:dCTP deaminase [Sarcina sp. DSM 11001]|uniref:dCTP deaminase n=1 Tax=Sarcina sp. DSM 11001 TaxID=1798184 RepID=UPI000891B712|nr:dCTP deaminase [Sarcina sp. DSM 11001]SDM09160.1 dCTP deaminase [Sarcina sp. DSM 11001]